MWSSACSGSPTRLREVEFLANEPKVRGPETDGRPIEDNLRDLRRHADDFEHRRGFTYTVLDPATADVIGCVYIYPATDKPERAAVQSWVRASRAELDVPLWRAVIAWLETAWPFAGVTYDDRPTT